MLHITITNIGDRMKTSFNKADWYILGWCLLFFLGIFRLFNFISVPLLFTLFAISFYYMILVFNRASSNGYIKALSILILMFTFYGFVYIIFGQTYKLGSDYLNKRTYLINIYKSLLTFFPIYYYSAKGYLTEAKLRKWVVVFFILAVATFFQRRIETLQSLWSMGYSDREEVTNNEGYFIIALLPTVLLFKNKIIQYSILSLCTILVFTSMKRGAILILAVMLLIYFYYAFKNRKVSKGTSKFLTIILLGVSFIFVYNYLVDFVGGSEYYTQRLKETREGYTSGRDELSEVLLYHYFHSTPPVEMLVGSGADATIGIAQNYAHNDWIEILINQGVLGFIVYLYYWLSLWKALRKRKHYPVSYFALLFFITYTFGRSVFSMSYFETPFYIMVLFAYFFAVPTKVCEDKNIELKNCKTA